jgi:anti-anti-sigma regulatory factor
MEIILDQKQARVPVTVLRPMDRINLGNTEELEQKARQAFDSGARYLLIDLTNVPSITSAGLRTIQVIYKLFEHGAFSKHKEVAGEKKAGMAQKSAHLKLLNPNSDLRRVLNLVGFDANIEILENEQDALKSF